MRHFLPLLIILIIAGCYNNEEILTQPAGSINYTTTTNEFYTRHSYYFYNEHEILIRIIHKHNGQEIGETTFEYDGNGKLIKKIEDLSDRSIYFYEYDDEGKLVFQKGTHPHRILYDSIGRIEKKEYLSGDLDWVNDEITYVYDSIDIWRIDEELDIQPYILYYRLKYRYNENGQLYEKELVEGAPELEHGPWEVFSYYPDGKLSRRQKYQRSIFHGVGIIEDVSYYYY
jgi:hypothetical protein